jgi:hypothetical protein
MSNAKNWLENNPWAPYLLLLGLTALAYWPISLSIFSLKNDALNYFLPVRYQVSQSIHHGFFPAWSPYFNLGYALLGDSQSGVWNPFVWLFSMWGPYSLYMLQLETLLYVWLAGCGMYNLCRYFNTSLWVGLMAALSFMFCGFISDSAQFLNWISGASFLPWVVRYSWELLESKTIRAALLTGLCFWLMLVTAYPAIFILSGYLFLALLIRQIGFASPLTWLAEVKRIFPALLLCAFCFLVLSFPAIHSYLTYLPLSQRGEGASFTDAMSNPWHPLLLFTTLTPLGAWNTDLFSVTDPLERNSYLGLVALWWGIAAMTSKVEMKGGRFIKYAVIVSFLLSLGQWGGLRALAFYTLPLMDSFRHPAMIKVFTLFFLIWLGARWFNQPPTTTHRRAGKTLQALTIVFLAWSMVVWWMDQPFFLHMNLSSGKVLKENWSNWQWMQLNTLLQAPFVWGLWRFYRLQLTPRFLVWLGAANLVLHTTCFCFFTVVKQDRAADIQALLNRNTQPGYPLPDQTSLAANSAQGMDYFKEIGTLNLYNKKVGRVDYRISPCNLTTQIQYWDSSRIRPIGQELPLLYAADSIAVYSNQIDSNHRSATVWIEEDAAFKPTRFNAHARRALPKWIRFNPNLFQFEVDQPDARIWVIQQNHYPNWTLRIDGQPAPLQRVNLTMMGFQVPAGKHQILLHFDHRIAYYGWLVTLLSLCILLAYCWRLDTRKQP